MKESKPIQFYASLSLASDSASETSQYVINSDTITLLGRSPECQIVLEADKYPTVSRKHAQIRQQQGHWQIADLGTINGTLVNGEKISDWHNLQSGDRIVLGLKGPEFIFQSQTLNATVLVEIPETPAEVNSPPPEPETQPALTPTDIIEPIPSPPQPEEETVSTPIPSVSSKSLWEIYNNRELCQLLGHQEKINAITIDYQHKRLVSGGEDKLIKLWNLEDNSEITTLNAHKMAITALTISPDGKLLASGGKDKLIKLWNLEDNSEITTLNAHKMAITALTISPDGQKLASGGEDKLIKLWNLEDNSEIITIDNNKQTVESLLFNQNGEILACVDNNKMIHLWSLTTQTQLMAISTPSWQTGVVAISADGKILAGSNDNHQIGIWVIE